MELIFNYYETFLFTSCSGVLSRSDKKYLSSEKEIVTISELKKLNHNYGKEQL